MVQVEKDRAAGATTTALDDLDAEALIQEARRRARRRRRRNAAIIVGIGILVAGATGYALVRSGALGTDSGSVDPVATAASLCHGAFGAGVVNSAPGTVRDVRTIQVGPAFQPPPHHDAFPGAKTTEVIGWCWTQRSGAYKLYAVAAGFEPVYVEGLSYAPSGPGPAPIP